MSGRARLLGPVVAVLATVVAIVPSLVGGRAADGVGMAGQRAGTCHDLLEIEEQYAVSDARPPVPCAATHLAETMALKRLPARLADSAERPSLERLQLLAPGLSCGYADVVRYLGSDPLDPHWFVTTEVRFPSAAAWAKGERRFRCDVVGSRRDSDGRPTRRGSLRKIMETPTSAAVRPCLLEGSIVPCDLPHDSEVVAGEGPPVGGGAPRAEFEDSCPIAVSAFVGGKLPAGTAAAVTDLVPGHAYCVLRLPPAAGPQRGTRAVQAKGGGS
ncbi:septum formation family protein [Aquihabitans sp. G128]|uniref:septum formation family protein n=1 Tax=Aquihabitans sp. G128 TaxID=2849779 RepID=UPI0020B3C47A|nr:septum formation family protein [Aquihabitans sp. G128]